MYDRLSAHLRKHHRSTTLMRDLVFNGLIRLAPCSIEELRADLAQATPMRPAVPTSTFYRTVGLFLKLDVAEMIRQDVIALRAPFRQHVHYLVCEDCGRNLGFNDAKLEQALERLNHGRSWEVRHHRVELIGRCGTCQVQTTAVA